MDVGVVHAAVGDRVARLRWEEAEVYGVPLPRP